MLDLLPTRNGALASVQALGLAGNRIGDDGLKALAEACRANGALPNCKNINVDGNPASEEAQQAVEDALKQR